MKNSFGKTILKLLLGLCKTNKASDNLNKELSEALFVFDLARNIKVSMYIIMYYAYNIIKYITDIKVCV